MTRKEYNGWTNYETWAVSLWLNNESGSQDYWLERARECREVDGENASVPLADMLKEEHQESLPEISGFAADLLSAAMSEVNWDEIAESLLDSAK